MSDKTNKHVWEYLTYYLELGHAPGFDVLVSGPWGIGKTHLMNAFLKEKFGDDKRAYVYVSLYGLSTIEEIDDALFQAVFPALTGIAAKVVGRVAKAGLKFLKVEPGDWNIKEFLNKFHAKIYVFDDFERCEAPINQVLGYINQFVEHGETKVIILGNEQEIDADENYARRREKLIGKTLQVQSAFDEAFAHFVSNIDHEKARESVKANAADVGTIYALSQLDNLRILQQTMWDFERFFAALSPEHQAHKEAMVTLLRLLFVLSFEFKAGRLTEGDILTGRGVVAMAKASLDKTKKTPIQLVGERYPMIDANDSVLSNELLVDFLVRGIVDPEAIRTELISSSFFVTVADEEPWRTVWNWLERSDAEFEAALAKMEKQFGERAFTRDGEILHVFGLRLFLSNQGVLPFSRAEIVNQGKKYIDDLYAAKRFATLPPDIFSEIRFQGWGGLGIYENETAEYKELFSYLMEIMQRALEDTYPGRALDLLSDMKTDVQKFYRHLCLTRDDANQYVKVPVLAKINVDQFVDSFLGLHPSEQHTVMMALKGRYEGGQLDRELKDEKPWIVSVRDRLAKETANLSRISQYRLQKQIEWYLQAPINRE